MSVSGPEFYKAASDGDRPDSNITNSDAYFSRARPVGTHADGLANGKRASSHPRAHYGTSYRGSAEAPCDVNPTRPANSINTPTRRRSVGVVVVILAAMVGAITGAVSSGLVVFAFDDDPEPVITTVVQAAVASDNSADNASKAEVDAPQPEIIPPDSHTSFIDVKAVYNKIKDSVVRIETVLNGGVDGSRGSGFVLSADGHIVTNAHVVDLAASGNPDDFDESQVEIVVRLSDGSDWEAKVLGLDVGRDLAVLGIEAEGLIPADLGQATSVEVGDQVIAVGNALSLGDTPTVTTGIVSAVDRSIDLETTRLSRLIQTDAAINPGNSGGPLLNGRGEVIGINTAIAGLEYDGLGFAIAIEQAMSTIESLEEGVVPGTAYLGVNIIPAERWEFVLENDTEGEHDDIVDLVIPGIKGAIVVEIVDGTAAQRAGMKAGDIIVEFDGTKIIDNLDLLDAIKSLLPGSDVNARVARKSNTGTRMDLILSITLGES